MKYAHLSLLLCSQGLLEFPRGHEGAKIVTFAWLATAQALKSLEPHRAVWFQRSLSWSPWGSLSSFIIAR